MAARFSPSRYFDIKSLQLAGLRLRMFLGLPNDFVGIGLVFTFLGLVAGLYFASQSMMSPDIGAARDALVLLLHAATFKFLTSITGIRPLSRAFMVAARRDGPLAGSPFRRCSFSSSGSCRSTQGTHCRWLVRRCQAPTSRRCAPFPEARTRPAMTTLDDTDSADDHGYFVPMIDMLAGVSLHSDHHAGGDVSLVSRDDFQKAGVMQAEISKITAQLDQARQLDATYLCCSRARWR